MERRDDSRDVRVGEVRQRAVGAHPAGVRPRVTVSEPLVVPGGGHREGRRLVREDDDARLGPAEPLLHDDPGCAGRPRRDVAEDRVERGQRLVERLADGDALAGGEAVCLDHDPPPRGVERGRKGDRGALRRERAGMRHSHPGRVRELVAERLRALDPCGGRGRPERGDPRGHERVRDARGERRLGADDGEVDPCAEGSRDDRGRVERVARGDRDAGHARDRVAAGEREDERDAGLPGQPDRQRVLAAARAHQQDAAWRHPAWRPGGSHQPRPAARGRSSSITVWVRSGPTETSVIGTPASSASAATYARALGGRSSGVRAPWISSGQPGKVS